MKRSFQLVAIATMALGLVFTSCKKDEEEDETKTNSTEKTVSLTTKNNETPDVWVYYSFETKAEVSGIDESNFKTSDAWDIAFHSRHVRLNGGESGEGMGAAYDAGVVEFSSVKTAPESGYTLDENIDIYGGMGQTGPVYISTPASNVFENAFDYDPNTHPPTYTATNHVYVIKTRTGKYAKIILEDYYNNTGESGYITFKYAINNDGERTF